MALIKESFFLTATNADILAAPSRLAAIPANGLLTLEAVTGDCDGTNFMALTILMPDGESPLDSVAIPAWASVSGADAVLDSRTEMVVAMPVQQGGHVLVQIVENGTVGLCFMMFTLEF